MKHFQEFISSGKVQKRNIEPAEARSLFSQAQERLADLKTLPLHDKNASFRFEDAYEVLREALQAFLALEGYKPYSHEAVFCFAFERHLISEAEYYKLDRFREIRNDINYRGKLVTVNDTQELLHSVEKLLPTLKPKFEEQEDKNILSSP